MKSYFLSDTKLNLLIMMINVAQLRSCFILTPFVLQETPVSSVFLKENKKKTNPQTLSSSAQNQLKIPESSAADVVLLACRDWCVPEGLARSSHPSALFKYLQVVQARQERNKTGRRFPPSGPRGRGQIFHKQTSETERLTPKMTGLCY